MIGMIHVAFHCACFILPTFASKRYYWYKTTSRKNPTIQKSDLQQLIDNAKKQGALDGQEFWRV
jgi:hypothetical protein